MPSFGNDWHCGPLITNLNKPFVRMFDIRNHKSVTISPIDNLFIEHLFNSFKNGENKQSQLIPEFLERRFLDGMSGIKTRHFYNNLANFPADLPSCNYLEIGTWAGSTLCSNMFKNNINVSAIDNFSWGGLNIKLQFLNNVSRCISLSSNTDNTLLTNTSVLDNTLLTNTSVLDNTLLTNTSVLDNTLLTNTSVLDNTLLTNTSVLDNTINNIPINLFSNLDAKQYNIKLPNEKELQVIDSDSFQVNLEDLKMKYNLYLYDGDHSYDAHYKALSYYHTKLSDVFIFVVDDWNIPRVRDATNRVIKDLNLTTLAECEVIYTHDDTHTSHEGDFATNNFWNGVYAAVLRKSNI